MAKLVKWSPDETSKIRFMIKLRMKLKQIHKHFIKRTYDQVKSKVYFEIKKMD